MDILLIKDKPPTIAVIKLFNRSLLNRHYRQYVQCLAQKKLYWSSTNSQQQHICSHKKPSLQIFESQARPQLVAADAREHLYGAW